MAFPLTSKLSRRAAVGLELPVKAALKHMTINRRPSTEAAEAKALGQGRHSDGEGIRVSRSEPYAFGASGDSGTIGIARSPFKTWRVSGRISFCCVSKT
jgi:hypothetical protein